MPKFIFDHLIQLRNGSFEAFANKNMASWRDPSPWKTCRGRRADQLDVSLFDIASYLKIHGQPGLIELFPGRKKTPPKKEFSLEETLAIAILLDNEAILQQNITAIEPQYVRISKQAIAYGASNCLHSLLIHMPEEIFKKIVAELIYYLAFNDELSVSPLYQVLFARDDLYETFKAEVKKNKINTDLGIRFLTNASECFDNAKAKEFIEFIIKSLPAKLPKLFLVANANGKMNADFLAHFTQLIKDGLNALSTVERSEQILNTLQNSGDKYKSGIKRYLQTFKDDCKFTTDFFITLLECASYTAAAVLISENLIKVEEITAYRNSVNSNCLHSLLIAVDSETINSDEYYFLLTTLLNANLLFAVNNFGYSALDIFLWTHIEPELIMPRVFNALKATLESDAQQWERYQNRGVIVNSDQMPVIPPKIISLIWNAPSAKLHELVFRNNPPLKDDPTVMSLAQALLAKLKAVPTRFLHGTLLTYHHLHSTFPKELPIIALEYLARGSAPVAGTTPPTQPQSTFTPQLLPPAPPLETFKPQPPAKKPTPVDIITVFKDILEKWYGPLVLNDVEKFLHLDRTKEHLFTLIVHRLDDLIRQWLSPDLTEAEINFIEKKLTIVVRNSRHHGVYAYPHHNGTELPQYPLNFKGRVKHSTQLTVAEFFAWALTEIVCHRISTPTADQTAQFVKPYRHHYNSLFFELALEIHSFEDLLLQSRIIKLIENSAKPPLSLMAANQLFPLLNVAAKTLSVSTREAYQHYILNNRPPLPATLFETVEQHETVSELVDSFQLSLTKTPYGAWELKLNNTDSRSNIAVFNLIYLTYLYQRLINSGKQPAILREPAFENKNKPTPEEIKRLNNYSVIQQMFSRFCCDLRTREELKQQLDTLSGEQQQNLKDFLVAHALTILCHSDELIITLYEPRFKFSFAELSFVLKVMKEVSICLQSINLEELLTIPQVHDAMDLDEEHPNPETMTTQELAEYIFNRGDGLLFRVLVPKPGQTAFTRVLEEFQSLEKSHLRPATLAAKDLPTQLFKRGSGLVFGPVPLQKSKWPKYVVGAFAHNALSNNLKTLNPNGDMSTDELIKQLEKSSQLRSYRSPIQFVQKQKHRYAKKRREFPAIPLNQFFMHFVDWCKTQYITSISHQLLSQYCHDLNYKMTDRLNNVFIDELMDGSENIAIDKFETAIERRSDPEKNPANKSWLQQLPTDQARPIDHTEIMLEGIELLPRQELDPDAVDDPYIRKYKQKCGDLFAINVDGGVEHLDVAYHIWLKEKMLREPENITFTYLDYQTGKPRVLPQASKVALIAMLESRSTFPQPVALTQGPQPMPRPPRASGQSVQRAPAPPWVIQHNVLVPPASTPPLSPGASDPKPAAPLSEKQEKKKRSSQFFKRKENKEKSDIQGLKRAAPTAHPDTDSGSDPESDFDPKEKTMHKKKRPR